MIKVIHFKIIHSNKWKKSSQKYVFLLLAYITNIQTSGAGSFHMDTLNKCLELGKSAGQCLDVVLLRVLREEEKKTGNRLIGQTEIFGFLR